MSVTLGCGGGQIRELLSERFLCLDYYHQTGTKIDSGGENADVDISLTIFRCWGNCSQVGSRLYPLFKSIYVLVVMEGKGEMSEKEADASLVL